MKFRSDFVTNSSSTSYIISIQITLADGEVLGWTGIAEESFELPTHPASPKEIAEANSFSEIAALLSSYASLEEDYSYYEYSAEEEDYSYWCDDEDYYKCVYYLNELIENIKPVGNIKPEIISVQISSEGLGHGGADFIKEEYIFNKKTNTYYGGWESSTGEEEIYCGDDYITRPLYFKYYEGEIINGCVIENGVLDKYARHDKIVDIPQGIFSIGDSAFYGCTGLETIVIPDSVTSIGNKAFAYCKRLIIIIIPDSVTSIGDKAFKYCDSLTSITIPDSVTSIGNQAFAYCRRLINIIIPDSVTSIGDSAFSSCTGLTSITIPDSVTEISEGAFRDCTSLTSITIPDSVTEISGSAFWGCTGLTSIKLPDSVTSIGSRAFYGCTKIKAYLEEYKKKMKLKKR